MWAIGGSVSKTRSMNSTWKIALDSAWAGPSWTSWARRDRSASCASTIRIWSSVGIAGSWASVTSELSPRSRNSHVLSRLRIPSSSRDSSVSWRPRSIRPCSVSPRSIRSRRSAAPASAAPCALVPFGGRLAGRLLAVLALERDEVVAEHVPARQLLEVRGAVAVADAAQRVGREGEGLGGFGVQLVVAGGRRFGARCIHRAECSRAGDYGERPDAVSGHPGPRDALAFDPEHPDPFDRGGVDGVVRDGQEHLLEARGGRVAAVEDRRPRAVVVLGADQPAGAELVGQVEHVGGRLVGQREAAHALGLREPDREVVDDRRRVVERGADRGHLAGEDLVRALGGAGAAAERRQQRDAEQQRGEDREQRAQPRDRLVPAEPPAQPGDPGVERAEAAEQQQDVGRDGRVEERAPGRRDREQEARHEERDEAHEQDRPHGTVAALPREGEEPDDRHRDAQQQQDVEQVVRDPREAHLEQAGRAHGEVARHRRRIVPGEDVEAGHGHRVRDRLAGQRVAEHGPVAGGPRREHEQADDGDDGDQAEPDGPRLVAQAPREPRPHEREPHGLVAGERREADAAGRSRAAAGRASARHAAPAAPGS